jgi:serine-type D-Ala-D-Ala carboxypeptidase (penicillin-binding protein 5/6)
MTAFPIQMSFLRSLIFAGTTVVAPLAALSPAQAQTAPAAYVIVDNTTGFTLGGTNPQRKLQVGSLTKIATAMVVIDWAEAKHQDLAEMATVPDSAEPLNTTGNGVGFHAGDRCSLRDLLYAAMLQSDNQAAETLAHHVGQALGSGQEQPVTFFVAQMNALARRLGMRNTRFLNPHGLDGLERALPYSTAGDLALLTRYALQHPSFHFFVSQNERRITLYNAANEPSNYLLRNTNELLGVEGIDGVKTGTTAKAGQCVVISAARTPESRKQGDLVITTPRRLDVVVLGSADRFTLARQLLARGWSLYDQWAAAGRPMKGWKAK